MDDEYRLWLIRERTFPVKVTADDRRKLKAFINGFSYLHYGIEKDPDTFIFAKPCKFAKEKDKNDRSSTLKINGHPIGTLYRAVFVLEYERLPLPGFCISHPCGRSGSRCAEASHMEVVPQKQNAERDACHERIRKWEIQQRNRGMKQKQRQGTVFDHLCSHVPQCYLQWGKFSL